MPEMPDRLAEILDEFAMLDAPLRLELLLDYARALPPLPERYHALRDRGLGRIHECQSPVFVFPEVEGTAVHLHGHVPMQSPTARGFVSVLVDGLDGATPAQVAAVPEDLLRRMGIGQTLGMTRQQGLTAVLHRVKHDVAQAAAA
jgi:cysteine desulfuration protein SufE